MLADRAYKIGLTFPPVPDATRVALTALLPPIATVSDPLDYTTPIWGDPARTGPVFAEAMGQTQAAAAVLVQDYPAAGLDESQVCYRNVAGAFIAAARAHGLPVAVLATLHENLAPTPATGWSRKVARRFWAWPTACVPSVRRSGGTNDIANWRKRRLRPYNSVARKPR